MTSDDKILYEVRYPDGDTFQMYARQVYYTEAVITLTNGNGAGGTVFVASARSGVTISQVQEMYPDPVTPDAGRPCGCGGVGDHGVDHDE